MQVCTGVFLFYKSHLFVYLRGRKNRTKGTLLVAKGTSLKEGQGFFVGNYDHIRVELQDGSRNLWRDRSVEGIVDRLCLCLTTGKQEDLLASMIPPIPMVMACVGTSSIEAKKRALALLVFSERVTTWVALI